MTFKAVVLVLAVGGCAMHAEVAQQPVDLDFQVARNYQAVYADTLRNVRNCYRPNTAALPGTGWTTVDGQLYSELGYGEISIGLGGLLPGLTSVTRIERAAGGARVQIKSANTGEQAARNDRAWLAHWARGGTGCPSLARLTP